MATERMIPRFVRRPWGVERLPHWLLPVPSEERIGEVWYEKTFADGRPAALLVKYLLTSERLSVQVHPDDEAARERGLRNGKSEAWYALAAEPGATVGLGLKRPVSFEAAKQAALDGSIVDLLDWRAVAPGDLFNVPARTIHAIGAGCLLVEVQQNSDTTYRLFDYGRPRELHLDDGFSVARLEPAPPSAPFQRVDSIREVLVANPLFTIERWQVPAKHEFALGAVDELWLIVLSGAMEIQSARFIAGEVALHASDAADVVTGPDGVKLLVAYPSKGPMSGLLSDARPAEHGFWDENNETEIDPGAPSAPRFGA